MEDERQKTETPQENDEKPVKKAKKPIEPGIIYLSRIPSLMGVKKLRHLMSEFGEVGKIFLQPDSRPLKFKKKSRGFTEGWVEFMNKKTAKAVAATLNNTQIGGKKRSRWHDEIWNMKYLPKFKWVHLNERLAYERAVHQQRMRTEISQVKKESSFFIENVAKSEHLKRKAKKSKNTSDTAIETETTDTETKTSDTDGHTDNSNHDREWTFKQRSTDEEIRRKRKNESAQQGKLKKAKTQTKQISKSFLQSIFSGGVTEDA